MGPQIVIYLKRRTTIKLCLHEYSFGLPPFRINSHYPHLTLLINIQHYPVSYISPTDYCCCHFSPLSVPFNSGLHKQITYAGCKCPPASGPKLIAGTHPFCVNANGTSILCDGRLLSPAMSANWAKFVSRSWSANRAERRDSSNRTSSRRFFNSTGNCKG